MRSYSKVWKYLVQDLARLEISLKLTIGEYFTCYHSIPTGRRGREIMEKWSHKPIHDFLIESVRGEIGGADFRFLANRDPNNFLNVLYLLYVREALK